MRAFPIIVVFSAVILLWRHAWVSGALNILLDKSAAVASIGFDDQIATDVLAERLHLGVPPLIPDHDLQRWLLNFAKTGTKDPDVIAQSVRLAWPQYQDVRILQTFSMFENNIQERVTGWKDAGAGELTHISVAASPGFCGFGWNVTVAAGIRLPVLNPEALNDPAQSRFYTTCTLCNEGQPCQIPRNSHRFMIRCQHCNHVYAMLAADSNGRFRYVTDFLMGYKPPFEHPPGQSKLAELMDIWRTATTKCRYVADDGSEDDDAWQTAEETQVLRQGDCEDSAILIADWLLARGFQARIAIGQYDAKRTAHAWVFVRVDGNDYVLETTEFPFNLPRPPLLSEVSSRYVTELSFDREAVYIPKREEARMSGDLWSEDDWQRIETVHPKLPELTKACP